MVQAGGPDTADVHARPFADRLEALQNGDVFRGVVRGCHVYNVRLVRRSAGLLCTTIVAAFALGADAAAAVYEDVPVPGGSEALAHALTIDPAPDRARFMYEITRLAYDNVEGRHPAGEQFLLALRQAVQRGRKAMPKRPGATDFVPVPLTADVWSNAIFHRRVEKDELVSAIIVDRSATLVCHGLTMLDDQTLQYLADHPAVLTRIYEK